MELTDRCRAKPGNKFYFRFLFSAKIIQRMMILSCLIIYSAVNFVQCLSDQEVCTKCPALSKQSHVYQFCHDMNSSQRIFISQSCCINKSSTYEDIIGLDWSDCGLKSIAGFLRGLTFLRELMLENNTDLTLTSDDFDGLINLDYLSLPDGSKCPGGNNSWTSTEQKNNAVICHTELNLCEHHNMTCPNNNSHCVMTGPGIMECLCNAGFYGYKCLRQGHFPTAGYTIVLCVCAVVLSVFLWCTQRRKVTKVH